MRNSFWSGAARPRLQIVHNLTMLDHFYRIGFIGCTLIPNTYFRPETTHGRARYAAVCATSWADRWAASSRYAWRWPRRDPIQIATPAHIIWMPRRVIISSQSARNDSMVNSPHHNDSGPTTSPLSCVLAGATSRLPNAGDSSSICMAESMLLAHCVTLHESLGLATIALSAMEAAMSCSNSIVASS